MKYKDPVTGELKDIYVKASDTLPVGSVVDYDGEDIPAGWEQVEEKNIVVNTLEGNETDKAPSVALFNNKFANIVNLFYPIGSIYMSVNSTNPSTLFGGTWKQLEDRFLLGAGSTYSNGATGGSATHKLTVNEMPGHTHNGLYWQGTKGISLNSGGTSGYHLQWESGDNGEATDMVTNTKGGSKAHNNMPPYLVVYMWKRTA